jgi:transcriptional regulator with XRE-family HTH domain
MMMHLRELELDSPDVFGMVLSTLRFRAGLKQSALYHLLGWSPDRYSRLESGLRAPIFEDLPAIASAFTDAGVVLSFRDVQAFVFSARARMAQQRTYKDCHTDEEWNTLFHQLLQSLGLIASSDRFHVSRPLVLETRHLLPRDAFQRELITCLESEPLPKLLVITGSPGVGKSSELSRLITALLRRGSLLPHIVLCDMRLAQTSDDPTMALRYVLATIATDLHTVLPQADLTLSEQITLLFGVVESLSMRLVIMLDHAESCLSATGQLEACWEQFFSRFLRRSHRATVVVATRQWPGWYGDERLFVTEKTLFPLSLDASVALLRNLGLASVPEPLLHIVAQRTVGIPRALEWVAALVQDPLAVAEWQEVFATDQVRMNTLPGVRLTMALQHLLTDPYLFSAAQADDLAPLLTEMIARQRLSDEAKTLLHHLALSPLPLSQSALESLCRDTGPRSLKEIRRASLLVSYGHRVHVNALVASAIIRTLTPQERWEREASLIGAYQAWIEAGDCDEREGGGIIYELLRLLLLHHRLLEAAQYAIRYGWFAFNAGHATDLAQLANAILHGSDWHRTAEQECGGLILRYFLLPYLGRGFDWAQQTTDYTQILAYITTQSIQVDTTIDMHVTRYIMVDLMNRGLFHDAETCLDRCQLRLAAHIPADADLRAFLIERRANLYGTWCEAAKREDHHSEAQRLREQAIDLYQQASAALQASVEKSEPSALLHISVLKRRLARCLNDLGYHLNRLGAFEQSLGNLARCITLKEQGYVDPGALAASYDEQAQSHAGLGHFQEACFWIDKAEQEVGKLAESGHIPSQEERWIYRISRARLLLLRGKAAEAEALWSEASAHIHPQRKATYDMLIDESQQELQAGQQASPRGQYQLDWRWIRRYRAIAAFDSLWWLAPSGPFTTDESSAWERLIKEEGTNADADETVRPRLETLVKQAREREIAAALREEREPQFWYPVIPLNDVQERLLALADLASDIERDEPNALVRHFYHDAIDEQQVFLTMIKGVHEGDSQTFQACNQQLHPQPTSDEMDYALSSVGAVIRQGLAHASPDIQAVAQHVRMLLQSCLLHPNDLGGFLESQAAPLLGVVETAPVTTEPTFAPQIVQCFLTATLREANYEGWSVKLDAVAQSAHIEQGLRQVILPASVPLSVGQVRDYLAHDLGGHVARAVAGEYSPLGLFGVGTKNNLTTEEGLALYLEQQAAIIQGKFYDESRYWLGALTTGMASGVLTHPQSFRSLFMFLTPLLLLYRLLLHSDADLEAAQARSQVLATTHCLRVFRGVPASAPSGICSTKDAVYLRGYQMIRAAVAADPTVIGRLEVGVVALEDLPYLAELDLSSAQSSLVLLALDPNLVTRLQSFV